MICRRPAIPNLTYRYPRTREARLGLNCIRPDESGLVEDSRLKS